VVELYPRGWLQGLGVGSLPPAGRRGDRKPHADSHGARRTMRGTVLSGCFACIPPRGAGPWDPKPRAMAGETIIGPQDLSVVVTARRGYTDHG